MNTIVAGGLRTVTLLLQGYIGGTAPANEGTHMSKSSKSAPTAVIVTTTATQILAANGGRFEANLANMSGQPVSLGRDNTVTVANGYPLPAGASLEDTRTSDAWWGIVASGTADVRVLEAS